MTSLKKQNGNRKSSSKDKKCLSLQKHVSESGSSGINLPESCITRSQKVLPKNQICQNELLVNVIPLSKKADISDSSAKVSNKSTCKRRKAFSKPKVSYRLRSFDNGRVLRSRQNSSKCNASLNPASTPENLVTRAKKGGKKKVKKSVLDELSRIKKHIRYMVNRMNYEQSLIDAYSGEGWKGQSADKLRPEKELGRAKSEILRCKLKIREIFQHLDSLLAEGRLQESLFDPDGIDSENIFCGKCCSKEVSTDNDIILCDGVCERGFHQKCLNPPLLSEDIPSGDEGWLCPQCDCKLECIDLLSEFLGKNFLIEDSWNKVFPEAAAVANGNGQNDVLNFPSDDSEDDDYNPDTQGVDVDEHNEGPSYEASDSSSSLNDSTSSDDDVGQANADLSTDDSEDENYDPDALDPDKEIQNNKSSSGSDFTSDSDEFCAELGKKSCPNETSSSSPPELEFFIDSGRHNMKNQDEPLDYTKLPSPILELEKQENGLMSTSKRVHERLDYKKLYDEAYGKLSSDSNDDEDWNEMITPKKKMKIDNKEFEEDAIHSAAKSTQMSQKSISRTSASAKANVPQEHHFISRRRKSDVGSKILYKAFQENQYATKEKKKSLAQELGMTYNQVTKWFSNARHNFRTGSTQEKDIDETRTTTCEESYKKKLNEVFQENQKPSKEKKAKGAREPDMKPGKILYKAFQEYQYPTKEKMESLAQELGMTYKKVTKWFSNTRHNFRTRSTQHKDTHEESYKKKMKEEHAKELGMTPEKVSGSFQTARHNSRAASMESGNPVTSNSGKAVASGSPELDIGGADETPRGGIETLKSCASPGLSRNGIDMESPEIPATNGDSSSKEKGNKAVGSTTPKDGSVGFRDGIREEDDRKKAIAKELRRMRTSR